MRNLINAIVVGSIIVLLVSSCSKEEKDEHAVKSSTTDPLFTLVDPNDSHILFNNLVTQTKENNHMINAEFISGGGVAVGDVNNDGLQDVFFTGNQVRDRLFLNLGDLEFKDISDTAGIGAETTWSSGVTFVDIDSDGDQDIYICRNVYLENEKSANQLYINNGDLTFTEQAAKFGLADKGFSVQSIFFDYDNDGLIDVYVVNQPPAIPNMGDRVNLLKATNRFTDRLYKNMGKGKFVDHTEQANLFNFGFGLSASVGDFDKDGWQDIYITNDFDVADHLYMNQQDGTFRDEITTLTKHISFFSMGSDAADYDNDGNLDIMVVDMLAEDHKRIKTHMGGMQPEKFWSIVDNGGHYQYMFNSLQRNNGNGTFSDLAQLGGVTSTDWSWAPLFADFDNDGYKDLFVSNGIKSNIRNSDLVVKYNKRVDSITKLARKKGMDPNKMIDVMDFVNIATTDKLANYIYRNNGDLTFTNKIKDWGMETPTLSNGAAYADFDLDGDLDLVINNIDDNAMLYKNNTVDKELGNFLRFKIDFVKDQVIYGTKITLFKEGKLWQMSHLANARGYMSKSEDQVHFGVGDTQKIEKAVIQWQDGSTTTLNNLVTNKVYNISIADKDSESWTEESPTDMLFEDITSNVKLNKVRHKENENDDYAWEILLPHKMSQFGPSIAVGDVNGDNREDFFLGGAAGTSGKLFVQNRSGTFDEIEDGAWTQDKASEDMGVAFIDIDGDQDLDMYIVSGGNEFNEGDAALQDRIYVNNGHGKFKKNSEGLPKNLSSGSCVVANDFDKDGDLDLFIGSRLIPRKYPHPASSQLLENKGGIYVDVSSDKAPDFENLGMVTAASWFDYNSDGLEDLIVVGEWMPVTIFTQTTNGAFDKHSIKDSEGWYFEVKTDDLDGDGDDDIVVGNLGLNYKYKASVKEPFEVHSYDFDNNGSLDIVLSYYEHGISFPVRGKSCSTQQIPSLAQKFESYESFGNSDLTNIYGESLKTALNLKAKTFASAYIENVGDGLFKINPLPSLAQVSSINTVLIKDYDLDGNKDLLISGNLYQSEIETPRNDASTGLFLKGNGKGSFVPVSIRESGFYAPNDAKDMTFITVGEKKVILVANNNDYLQAIELKKSKENLAIK